MLRLKQYLIIGTIIIVLGTTFVGYALLYKENPPEDTTSATTTETIIPSFYIDIKGAVKKPGVYEFKEGERIFDAIAKAGGLTKNGNTSNINLSQKLTEEMVVYIFTNTELKKGTKSITCQTTCECETITINNCINNQEVNSATDEENRAPDEENRASDKTNINKATLDQLMTLPGIGESKAKAIIDYREKQGQFTTTEDLTKVSGIGQTIFDNLKDLITV